MLTRALIVLLLVLNLGVALWWINRPAPAAPAGEPLPPGVHRLQLVSELPARPEAPPPVAATVVDRCLRFGPFATAAEAGAAREQLAPRVIQVRPYRDYPGDARSWKVILPPAADIAAAEAAAKRIAAAGFRDWFVIRDGEDARAVALGLYRNEASAQERATVLREAGFMASALFLAVPLVGPGARGVDGATGKGHASTRVGRHHRRGPRPPPDRHARLERLPDRQARGGGRQRLVHQEGGGLQPRQRLDEQVHPLVAVLVAAGREHVDRAVQVERVAGEEVPHHELVDALLVASVQVLELVQRGEFLDV